LRAPGFTSPGSFRPQGFSPSRRLAPRHACPALFRAGALLEFHALQSFSLVRSRDTSRCPLPSCHSPPHQVDRLMHPQGLQALWRGRPNRRRLKRGFKALLPGASPLLRRQPLSRRRARCSPGLRSPSGLSVTTSRRCASTRLPPTSFRAAPEGASPAPRSLHKVETGRAGFGTVDPPGVSHLVVVLLDLGLALSWLMVSPRGPHRVAAA
jgi:hypothetical protein